MTKGLTTWKIDQLIKENEVLSSGLNFDRNNFNDPYEREIERLSVMRVFVEAGVPFELDASGGTILIEGKYVYALRSRKWRVKGSAVWYRTRSPADFVKRFIKKATEEKRLREIEHSASMF